MDQKDRVIAQLRQQNVAMTERMSALMDQKDQVIAELRQEIASMTDLIRTLTETNDALSATIKELQETIRELQRQLNQNSNNSSKPPSSDGFNKPAPKSLRKKSGKKLGGQTGHPGAHMTISHEPDDYKTHLPHKCVSCPHLAKCTKRGIQLRTYLGNRV